MLAHKTTDEEVRMANDELEKGLFEECSEDELAGYLLGGDGRVVVVSSSVGQTAVWRKGPGAWWIQDVPFDSRDKPVLFRGVARKALNEAVEMAGFVDMRG
jgi:hypothetical protein